MIWRWDQGRTTYFDYNKIVAISSVLLEFNGADMQTVDSAFRDRLTSVTGLPFAPPSYTIKRNYKRVFECAMLATYIGNRLIISDIGRALAENDVRFSSPDKYLSEVERRFRYPYPAFNNYSDVRNVCFPFLAILKLLFAKALREGDEHTHVTLDEIGGCLIANNVSGLEDLDFYWDISARDFSFDSYSSNDQKRQVREMMSFIGQHSFLIYRNSSLQLTNLSLDECENAFEKLLPFTSDISSHNTVEDFLHLTSVSSRMGAAIGFETEDEESLESFAVREGRRVFTQHFRIERNHQLRKAYLSLHPEPICDVCGRNMRDVYPWTVNMLEIHHLCPLSSFSDEEAHQTNIDDVVGLCPSCHRAVHLFYKVYLTNYDQEDFTNAEEAISAYQEAKAEVLANV